MRISRVAGEGEEHAATARAGGAPSRGGDDEARFDVAGSMLALALVALLATAVLQPSLPAMASDDLTWDFSTAPYLAHGAVRFADGAVFTGYRYSSDAVRAGEVLTVTTDWTAAPGQDLGVSTEMFEPGHEFPQSGALRCGTCNAVTISSSGRAAYGRVTAEIHTADTLPPGEYFVAMSRTQPALTAAGVPRGRLYLRPVRVLPPAQPAPPAPTSVAVGPVDLAASSPRSCARPGICVDLHWSARAPLSTNYGLSLRLSDAAGNEWATFDTLAGYGGFYPSALWRAGEAVNERVVLQAPEGLPPGEQYTMTVTLYDVRSLQPAGATAFGSVAWSTPTLKPGQPLVAQFGGLGLHALDAPGTVLQGEPIPVTAQFSVVAAPLPNLTARWKLVARAGGAVAYTLETPLAPGSATGQWPQDTFVLGKHTLAPPADLPPGEYVLELEVVPYGGPALGTYVGPVIAVTGRPRAFTVPPLAVTMNADYGGIIRLYGYTLERQGDAVRLTLAWGALLAPGRDYKVFVHVFDPATEAIPAQHDSMPRENEYPTSRWVQGEVVTDTITLDLSQVPPGTYRIGVGLYDETGRLGERVVLPDTLTR